MIYRAHILESRVPAAGARAPSRRASTHEHTPVVSIYRLSASQGDGTRTSRPVGIQLSRSRTDEPRPPLRVVVVEDDAVIAMELEMMLQDLGAEVVGVATTATEAVRLADLHRPDCATMDISIRGDRDGVSAAIEIYEMLGIRSIFVSAYGNDETTERAAPANPIGWVKKPFEIEDLQLSLNRVLDED